MSFVSSFVSFTIGMNPMILMVIIISKCITYKFLIVEGLLHLLNFTF